MPSGPGRARSALAKSLRRSGRLREPAAVRNGCRFVPGWEGTGSRHPLQGPHTPTAPASRGRRPDESVAGLSRG
ncbi:hypothetical protein GCM10010272_25690 [Streptomyces lateritius]|nr:hypothetical protein GCM10010272_25690 [Streptomyces lateritius]